MYIPKSKIQTNLYTNGDEFLLTTGNSYTGPYYSISNTQFFTGKNPDVPNSQELIPSNLFKADTPPDNLNYIVATNGVDAGGNSKDTLSLHERYQFLKQAQGTNTFTVNQRRLVPPYSPVLPIEKDYKLGVFTRYFCKKRNNNVYIETNKDTYNRLEERDSTIAFDLYRPFKLSWTLTAIKGGEEEVQQTNANMVKLTSIRQKTPGLDVYLKFDYTKYYQSV